MNKFGDLPGIDYNSQEIFESSDIETEDHLGKDSKEEASQDINLHELQAQFAEIEVTSNEYDFSGNLLNQRGFQIEKKKETRQERLARIKRELEEVLQEEESSCPETDDLLQTFNSLNTTPDKQKFPKEEELKINEILIPPPGPVEHAPQQTATFISLESKLNQLEKQLGIDNSTSQPIQHSINDITRKLDIINHADFDIDSIKSKIESTGKEMEKLELNKRLFGWENVPISKTDKIDELYKILPDLKKYCGKAPLILERIKGLSMIHRELEESLNFTINLNQFISDLEQDMQQWNKSLDVLSQGLDTLKDTFETNSKRFENRLEELEKKIAR